MGNQRKTYIINPKFQFKFSFIICSLIFVSSLVYPVTIYDLFGFIMDKFPNDAAEHERNRNNLLFFLVLTQLAFTGLSFIFCLFISHKIAGPLYKLTMYLGLVREGNADHKLSFRDGDNFKEIATEINDTLEFLKDKNNKNLSDVKKILESSLSSIDESSKPKIESAINKINELTE